MRLAAVKDEFDRERARHARDVARLTNENAAIREQIGSLATASETSRQAMRSERARHASEVARLATENAAIRKRTESLATLLKTCQQSMPSNTSLDTAVVDRKDIRGLIFLGGACIFFACVVSTL